MFQRHRSALLTHSHLVAGVDFTKSNLQSGMRTFQNQSLHQLFHDGRLNPYQEVIKAIGETLST